MSHNAVPVWDYKTGVYSFVTWNTCEFAHHVLPIVSGDELLVFGLQELQMKPLSETDGSRRDREGQSLAHLCGTPMDMGRFLTIAIAVATELGELHKDNIIHKNIQPATIIVNPDTASVILTDRTGTLGRPHKYLKTSTSGNGEGILAYMSPEQTGRMNRAIDCRTDLYSLGVTFYQMLTGRLPFQANDPLEWVHCHIARMPSPPSEIVLTIPRAVSGLVMKLLAKTAEERYQTAQGLKIDLEYCRTQLEEKGFIESFALGEWDVPDRLLMPQKLYGREQDVGVLLNAFDRVVLQGVCELVLVAGYAGIGKTSLVRELHRPVAQEQGFFLSGKCAQYKRDFPYSTVAEAFKEIVQHILTQADDRIEAWAGELQRALGTNGQLIVEIIPQVELIIGKQPAVPDLSPAETHNRFHAVFRQFVSVFTSREHPLVVFLDDLQWVDAASLKLIEHLATNPDKLYLLLIGAYRDNEVTPSHPLMRMLEDVRRSQAPLQTITLAPLSFLDLARFTADAFRSDAPSIEPLTKLVYEKTAGNPFFAIQFLTTLYTENLLKFDRDSRMWQWDISHIRAKGYADNVVDLMAGKLKRLPPETQKAVRLAACIGTAFDLQTLALINDRPEKETWEALWGALKEGMVLPLEKNTYVFLHDRVQQAAYSLIPDDQREANHLEIGRLLLKRTPLGALEDCLFDIVNQLNTGVALISDRTEKYRVAELNLMAARKAKASTAYESALGYLTVGEQLFDDRVWDTHHDLAFDLYREFATVEYLNSNFKHSQELIDLLLTKASSDLQKAQLYNLLIVQYTLTAQYSDAIQAGKDALRLLKVSFPETDLERELAAELSRHMELLGDRSIASLTDAPEMSDQEKRVAQDLLSCIMVPARYTDSLLFSLTTITSVNLSVEFGPTRKSPVGYTAYGMFLSSQMDRYKEGHEFGELALRISERFNDSSQKCQAHFVLANYLNHWVYHLKHADAINDQGFEAGMSAGEMQWSGYIAAYRLFHPFYRGVAIDAIQRDIPHLLLFARKTKNQWAIDTLIGLQLGLRALRRSGSACEDSGHASEIMNEEDYLASCRGNKSFGAFCRYLIVKAQTCFLFGRLEDGLDAIAIAREFMGLISCSISVAEHNFYHSLIAAALFDSASAENRDEYVQIVRTNQEHMNTWASHCRENFEHQYLLVEAELARITGRDMEAMRLYEQAIESARTNQFVQNQGIGFELAARFYKQRGFDTIALTYLREARACYVLWGADRKVVNLEDAYPDLEKRPKVVLSQSVGTQVGHLDAIAVVKALQVISGEIVLSRLLEKLMRIVLENAGAQKGYFILADGEDLAVEAEASVQRDQISVFHPRISKLTSVLPLSIANYVRRTQESVILDDASSQQMFSSDPYIETYNPVSVLCLPIIRHDNLIGLLYLENNLMKGAFTEERIAVLELLASQAAISLEIATLYQGLRRAEEKYRGIFENMMEGVFQTTPEGHLIAANPALASMFGYESPEALMHATVNLADHFHVDREILIEFLSLLEKQGQVKLFELRACRRDGTTLWLAISSRTVHDTDGTLLYYEGTVKDITERKEAETERTRLVAAIEQAAEGIMITDPDGVIQYANSAFKRMTGYSGKEIVGQHTRILRSDKYDENFYRNIRETLAQGEIWSGRVINTRKDGSFYEAEVTGSPIRDESGKYHQPCEHSPRHHP